VLVNTVCNRNCPLCCYGDVVNRDGADHFPAEEILDEISKLHRVGSVYLSGGEPTLHPEIEHLLTRGREIRGASHFGLITNGARLLKVASAVHCVDTLRVSVFDGESAVATEYAKIKPDRMEMIVTHQNHYTNGGGVMPCDALTNTLSIRRGRVYPCCVAAGVTGAQSTELTDGWEKRLLSVEAPCEGCFNGSRP
jgi:MoaA/NifB/PqqE/SkfB family radical SAM enzyme